MATDGPTPPDCDSEIYNNGEVIACVQGSSNAIENWVKLVAKKSDARVDWHYVGGRGCVKFLGTPEQRTRVVAVMEELRPEIPTDCYGYSELRIYR